MAVARRPIDRHARRLQSRADFVNILNGEGEVTEIPLTWYLLGFGAFWLGLGNMIMFRMANFRF